MGPSNRAPTDRAWSPLTASRTRYPLDSSTTRIMARSMSSFSTRRTVSRPRWAAVGSGTGLALASASSATRGRKTCTVVPIPGALSTQM